MPGSNEDRSKLGRGSTAVEDMKRRLAAMKNSGLDDKKILDNLWDRNHKAVHGEGYTYEYVESR